MTRQEKIKFLGKHTPSEFNGNRNFLSYFIIPIPHKFYDKRKSFKDVQGSCWKILNLKSDKKERKRLFDYNNDLKKYIYEGMIPENTEEFFIKNKSNVILKNKKIYKKLKVMINKNNSVDIILDDIDLWILEGNIAFFVLKIKLPKYSNATVNDLSNVNRILRDFRKLKIENNKIFLTNSKKESNFIDFLLDLTKYKEKSFLNITRDEIEIEDFEKVDKKTQQLYPIYHSSYYSKLLTAVHITIEDKMLSQIEPPTIDELKNIEIDGTGPIEEMAFWFGSTSDFYPSKGWESNENYINKMVNKGGINIWKYWSGIALKDTLAFFSVNDGGGMIVSSCKDIIYFIYILNLYVNYRIKLLEHNLILDKYFVDIENNLKNLEEVQRLHNVYMSEEIAIRFQPNEIHQAIMKGLETKELFKEVEENIKNSYERAKDNTGIIVSIFSAAVAVIGFFLTEDQLKSFISSFYKESPKTTILVALLLIISILIIILLRKKIYKYIANFKRKVFRNVL